VAALQKQLPTAWLEQIDFVEDYQLQVEHALDLVGRDALLFIDASLNCDAPFSVSTPLAQRDTSYTSHALSVSALLQVFCDVHGHAPPPASLLAIRGMAFELGEPMSPQAQTHLTAATIWALGWVESFFNPAMAQV
jgi:hydrogenase maturation protease